MSKQTAFVIIAAILLSATASAAVLTIKAVNGQSNATSAGGTNMTKSILTNATSGAAMKMTGPAKNTTVGNGGY